MALMAMCTVSFTTVFNAACLGTEDGYTWTSVTYQSDANLQTALLAGVVATRSYTGETTHLMVLADGVTVTKNHDGSLVRESDASAHPCDDWASTDYILRTVVGDVDSMVAYSLAGNLGTGDFNYAGTVPIGGRVGAVNLTAPDFAAGVAMRLSSPSAVVASWTRRAGVAAHAALVDAPSTVVAPALVTALASPGSGTGAPAVTTSAHLLTTDGVYAVYRALHTAATAPGPVLLSLSTLATDLYTHQANTLVAEAVATAGRVFGWVGGMAAKRGGWTGAVAVYGGETIADNTMRVLSYSNGAVQTGVNAAWGGSGAPIAYIRTTVPPADPLADGMIRVSVYLALSQAAT